MPVGKHGFTSDIAASVRARWAVNEPLFLLALAPPTTSRGALSSRRPPATRGGARPFISPRVSPALEQERDFGGNSELSDFALFHDRFELLHVNGLDVAQRFGSPGDRLTRRVLPALS